jgi:hypothetical protein
VRKFEAGGLARPSVFLYGRGFRFLDDTKERLPTALELAT